MTSDQQCALSKARTHLFIALDDIRNLRRGMTSATTRRGHRLQRLAYDLARNVDLADLLISGATHPA